VSLKSMGLINCEDRWLSFEGIEPSDC
jgi:hypothetical protein